MVNPPLPVPASLAVTVSDLKTLRQLVESGQLKTWQAGVVMDVVVSRREPNLLVLDTGKGLIGLPVPDKPAFPAGTALQLQVLALAPLQVRLQAATGESAGKSAPVAPARALVEPVLPAAASISPTRPAPLPTAPTAAVLNLPPPSQEALVVLSQTLDRLLTPAQMDALAPRLLRLPQTLQQWSALSWQPTTATAPRSQAQLAQNLLQHWPSLAAPAVTTATQDGSIGDEPPSLEALLRQALFGQPLPPPANPASGRPVSTSTDWLTWLGRLLLPSQTEGTVPSERPNVASALPPAPLAGGRGAEVGSGRPETAAPTTTTTLPAAADWLEELASVLGKQQQHWLHNLQTDPRQQPLYAELLLRHGEQLTPFQLSIRREGPSPRQPTEEPGDAHHVVRLRFDLPELGVCQFLLDLRRDDLQLHFYSERADTVSLFNAHVETLAQTLAADAIHLDQVQSHRVEQLPGLQPQTETGFHVHV